MNALTLIDSSDLVLAHIDTLILSPMNPRQHVTKEEIGELADSLIKCGLIQNLSGYLPPGNEGIEIVAGGRRLRALRLLADQGFMPGAGCPLDLTRIPVKITRDQDVAAQWAMGENVARKAPNVADEVAAYQALADRGVSPGDIARAYAVTEIHVKRRLKLATLPDSVMEALRAEKIGYGQAAALTLCNDTDHIEQLLATTLERGWTEQNMRNHLAADVIRATDRRAVFVGLEQYEMMGGRLTRDMFTDFAVIHDADILDRLFAAKLQAEAVKLVAAGEWSWVEPVTESYVPYEVISRMTRVFREQGELSEEEAEEYDSLAELAEADELSEEGIARLAELEAKLENDFSPAQRSVAGCFLYVTREGALRSEAAFIRKEDEARAIEAGVLRPRTSASAAGSSGAADAAEVSSSPFSAAVLADMKAVRLAAVQSAMIDKPEVLIDLLAFAMSPDAGSYQSIFDLRLGKPQIVPGVDDGFTLDDRLHRRGNGTKVILKDAFAAFRKKPKKAKAAALHEAVARAINYGCSNAFNGNGDPLFDVLEDEADATMRAYWTPTKQNFFGRVTSGYLDQVYCFIFNLAPESADAKAFAAMKKGEKADKLEMLFDLSRPEAQGYRLMTDAARDLIAAWVPDCFGGAA